MSISLRTLKNYPSEDILYYRIIVASILLAGFILLFRRDKWNQDIRYFHSLASKERRRVIRLVLLASVLIFANWFTFIYAVNHVSIQSAALAYMICPLITAFAAFFLLKEDLGFLKKIALFLALIACILLASGSFVDILWALFIASSYAFYLITQRIFQGFDKLNVLALQLVLCSVVVIPLLLFSGHSIPADSTFWTHIFIIALLFTIIPLYLSMFALTKISSSTTGILLYINPIIAFLLAIFYFHEGIELYKYFVYLLLFIAIAVFNWNMIRKLGQKQLTRF